MTSAMRREFQIVHFADEKSAVFNQISVAGVSRFSVHISSETIHSGKLYSWISVVWGLRYVGKQAFYEILNFGLSFFTSSIHPQ